jgi:hypothetical protein
MAATKQATKTRRAWTTPRVECQQVRPEVTAYSGDTGPWQSTSR